MFFQWWTVEFTSAHPFERFRMVIYTIKAPEKHLDELRVCAPSASGFELGRIMWVVIYRRKPGLSSLIYSNVMVSLYFTFRRNPEGIKPTSRRSSSTYWIHYVYATVGRGCYPSIVIQIQFTIEYNTKLLLGRWVNITSSLHVGCSIVYYNGLLA